MPKQFVVSNPLPSKIEDTPNGVAVSLRLYVYPEGHGYVSHSEPDDQGRVISVPAASSAEMLGILSMLVHEMWRQAVLKEKSKPAPDQMRAVELRLDLDNGAPTPPLEVWEAFRQALATTEGHRFVMKTKVDIDASKRGAKVFVAGQSEAGAVKVVLRQATLNAGWALARRDQLRVRVVSSNPLP